MKWPQKETGVLRHRPDAKLTGLWTAYLIAKLLATTLAWPFWFAEQWRGKLADELERRRT
jgi:hypothetical protein